MIVRNYEVLQYGVGYVNRMRIYTFIFYEYSLQQILPAYGYYFNKIIINTESYR